MGEQEGDDDSAKVEHRQAPIADASLGLKGSWIGRTFRFSIDFMPGVWNIGWQRGGWKWRGCHTQSAFHKVRFPANLVGLSSGSIYSRIPTYLARTTHLKDHSNLLRRVVHPGEVLCLAWTSLEGTPASKSKYLVWKFGVGLHESLGYKVVYVFWSEQLLISKNCPINLDKNCPYLF